MSPVQTAGGGTVRSFSGRIGHLVSGAFVQKWPPVASGPSANALRNSTGVAMHTVASAYTQSQMQAWKNAGGTHVLLQLFWDRWQPTQGGAIASNAVTEWRGWVAQAQALGLRVVAELSVAAPPSWFTTAAPRFKNQNGADFTGSGDTIRDFVFSSVTRGFYSDFATKALAQLTPTDFGQIDFWRVGGGPLGELTYPPPHELTADGTGWDWWLGSAAAQYGTNRVTTIPAPPQTGTFPGKNVAPGNTFSTADLALNDWYQNALVDFMTWWIGLHRAGGWTGVVSVLHASWGVRPTRGTGDSVWRNEAAAGTDWDRQIAAYPDASCAPWCTWANRQSDGTGDGDLSPSRYLAKLAAARGVAWGLIAENASGASPTELTRIYTSTSDGVLNNTPPYRGVMWVSYDSLTGGGSGDATLSNITTGIAANPADPSKSLSSTNNGTVTTQPRLTLKNNGMVQRNSVNYRTAGVNAFQIIHNDYPQSRLMSHAEIDSLLDKTVTLKAGIVRAHTLGINIGNSSNHLVTGVTGTGTNPTITYNAAVWEVMDYAVAAAASRGLYLMVPLTDELGYYHGGKRNWVNFRRPGTCSTDYNVKSANSSTERAAETYFYTDTQIVADYDKYISDWLNHINQYTGRAYKDEPAIAVVELGNELWTAAQDAPSWASARAQKIKTIAPNVLVADGSATDGQIINTTSLASPYIDVFGTHPYSTFGSSDVASQAAQVAAAGKAYHVGEYAWSKTTAPDIESTVRNTGNVFFSAFWSLQNDSDLHNNGAAYGGDDVSLYVPGKDSTQTAAVARLQSHSQTLQSGAATATPPTGPATTDNFTGTNGAAPNAVNWTTYLQNASTITIQNNAALFTAGNLGSYGDKATLVSKLSALADATVTYTVTPTDVTKEFYFETALRAQTSNDSIADTSCYRLEINNSGVGSLSRRTNGSSVGIGSPYTIPGWGSNVTVNVQFSVIASTLQVFLWTGSTKPSTPNISGTDSTITAPGVTGFVLNGGNAATSVSVSVDNWAKT